MNKTTNSTDAAESTSRKEWSAPKLAVLALSNTSAGLFESMVESGFLRGNPDMGGCIIGDNCMGIS